MVSRVYSEIKIADFRIENWPWIEDWPLKPARKLVKEYWFNPENNLIRKVWIRLPEQHIHVQEVEFCTCINNKFIIMRTKNV